jgi:hypothetical protein
VAQERGEGKAVQVDPIKPTLKALAAKPLKLKHGKLVSSLAFNFNLCRFMKGDAEDQNRLGRAVQVDPIKTRVESTHGVSAGNLETAI